MNRLVTLAAVSAIALAACSSSETTSTVTVPAVSVTLPDTSTTTSAPQIPQTTTSAATDTTAPPPTVTVTVTVTEDDLVRFVAATETVLRGTPNQGIVYDAPEIYIAIAQTACARFSAGDTFEEVSNDLLTELATTSPADDNRLVGAILGAATQTICPEHAA